MTLVAYSCVSQIIMNDDFCICVWVLTEETAHIQKEASVVKAKLQEHSQALSEVKRLQVV